MARIVIFLIFFVSIVLAKKHGVECQQANNSVSIIYNSNYTVNVTYNDGNLFWQLFTVDAAPIMAPSPVTILQSTQAQTILWDAPLVATCIYASENTSALVVAQTALAPFATLVRYVSFQMYEGAPFVRITGNITNTGASAVLLSYSSILNMDIPANQLQTQIFHIQQWSSVYDNFHFDQIESTIYPGKVALEFMMGSSPGSWSNPVSCGWFASNTVAPPPLPMQAHEHDEIEKDRDIPGFVAGIEFNGKSTFHGINTGVDGLTHIWVDINYLNHSLAENEVFEIPGAFVGLFEGDWDEASWATQQFASQYLYLPLPDDNYPYVQYDSWNYLLDINEENQMAALNASVQLGIEVFVLDFGWAIQLGEWVANSTKFPNGLKPLVDFAHANGIKFGLHLPFAEARITSPIAVEHPDWLVSDATDYWDSPALCLSHAPCQSQVLQNIYTMIDTYYIDYIVQDGEDMVKMCTKSTHTHNVGDSNYANSVQGLDEVLAAIRAYKPDIVLEFCADGGTMLTHKMVQLYDTAISVDCSDSYSTRQGIYGMSYAFSPRYSARYIANDARESYNIRSGLFGGPLILQNAIGEWSEEDIANVKVHIDMYKQYRKLIRSGKVYHLIAPAALSPDDGNPKNGFNWDAIQSVSPAQDHSVVFVFRATAGLPQIAVKPKGLISSAKYLVQLHDAGTNSTMTGSDLKQTGVAVALDEWSSEVIDISLLTY